MFVFSNCHRNLSVEFVQRQVAYNFTKTDHIGRCIKLYIEHILIIEMLQVYTYTSDQNIMVE
jgi:hypothetical protein